jgi:hypothetical protein
MVKGAPGRAAAPVQKGAGDGGDGGSSPPPSAGKSAAANENMASGALAGTGDRLQGPARAAGRPGRETPWSRDLPSPGSSA